MLILALTFSQDAKGGVYHFYESEVVTHYCVFVKIRVTSVYVLWVEPDTKRAISCLVMGDHPC